MIISSTHSGSLSELWQSRRVVRAFVERDIRVRYRQTALGILWAIIKPVTTMIIFTIIFGRVARFQSPLPYPLMVAMGVVPWMFFSSAVSECGESMVGAAGIIGKIYFPRIIIPLAVIGVQCVDLTVSLAILAGLMLWYGCGSWSMLLGLLLLMVTTLGCGLWLSALNVKYRDFRHVTPFLMQIGFFLSPVGYPSSIVKWQYTYHFNPLAGVIDLFRGSYDGVWMSAAVAGVILLGGVGYFRKVARVAADII